MNEDLSVMLGLLTALAVSGGLAGFTRWQLSKVDYWFKITSVREKETDESRHGRIEEFQG